MDGYTDGFLKAWRRMMEWEHYLDITTFKLFWHFLFKANFKDTKYMGFLVPRGSLVIRESKIGDECGLTYQEVRTSMIKLQGSGEITKKSTNKFTVITIVKYDDYQSMDAHANEQSTNNQRTINELSTSIEEEGKERKNISSSSATPPKAKKTYPDGCREMELARLLAKKMRDNNPACRLPDSLNGWCDTFRLMLERDNRDYADIRSMIAFCQWDEFWRANILSPKKLREKYDQLTLKREEARREHGRSNNASG